MKRNYVAPTIMLHLVKDDMIRTSGIPEGVEVFDTGWLS